MLIKINDRGDPALDVYVRLTGAQLRHSIESECGVMIAESPTVIDVALDAGCQPISILTDERLLSSDAVMSAISRCEAKDPSFPVYTASRDVLTAITGFELTRGALAAFARPSEPSLDSILTSSRRIAVLEAVTDSTNVGALFRSAAALGVDAVLVSPTCCDPLCRRALRVSMGTVLLIPRCHIGTKPEDWPCRGIDILHSYGFKAVSMALRHDTVDIDDPILMNEEKLAIILGTEGTGLTEQTIALSDYTVKIPMEHGVDSLNVAAAGAVAFWQLTRKNKEVRK